MPVFITAISSMIVATSVAFDEFAPPLGAQSGAGPRGCRWL